MTNADANRTAIRYIEEVTPGETPATPVMQEYRITGEGLNANRDFTSSVELRADRQIADTVAVSETNEGDLNIEWSFNTHDDFMEGALQDTWSTELTYSETDVTFTGGVDTMQIDDGSSSFPATDITVGQWLRVSGSSEADNNGIFRVATVSTSTITFDAKFGEDTFTSVTDNTASETIELKGKYLKNGVTRHSYTIEKEFADISRFFTFRGMEVGTMSFNAEVGSVLNGAFGFTGRSSSQSSTTVASSSLETTSTDVLNSVDNLGQIRINDSLFKDGFLGITMELNNNPRPQQRIGSFALEGIGMGTIELTGTGQVYYSGSGDAQEIFDDFTNSTSSSIELSFTDADGNTLMFVVPRIKFGATTVTAGGINTDVVLDFEWSGIRDADSDTTLQVHSIPA